MDIKPLVDADNGLVSRRIYIEKEIYEQELEEILARCFLLHASQNPTPGDFATASMGEDPRLLLGDNKWQNQRPVNIYLSSEEQALVCVWMRP